MQTNLFRSYFTPNQGTKHKKQAINTNQVTLSSASIVPEIKRGISPLKALRQLQQKNCKEKNLIVSKFASTRAKSVRRGVVSAVLTGEKHRSGSVRSGRSSTASSQNTQRGGSSLTKVQLSDESSTLHPEAISSVAGWHLSQHTQAEEDYSTQKPQFQQTLSKQKGQQVNVGALLSELQRQGVVRQLLLNSGTTINNQQKQQMVKIDAKDDEVSTCSSVRGSISEFSANQGRANVPIFARQLLEASKRADLKSNCSRMYLAYDLDCNEYIDLRNYKPPSTLTKFDSANQNYDKAWQLWQEHRKQYKRELISASLRHDFYHLRDLIGVQQQNGDPIEISCSQNQTGWTPLHFACFHRDADSVRFLLQNGAQVNIRSSGDVTPLMVACKRGDIDCVDALLKLRYENQNKETDAGNDKLDCNAVDKFGNSALHYAAKHGKLSVLCHLLNGCWLELNLQLRNAQGHTMFESLSREAHKNFVSRQIERLRSVYTKHEQLRFEGVFTFAEAYKSEDVQLQQEEAEGGGEYLIFNHKDSELTFKDNNDQTIQFAEKVCCNC